MQTFKVERTEEYAATVEEVAKSLAKSDIAAQTTFIAEYFETLGREEIEAISKRLTANDFHRGRKEICALAQAVQYHSYSKDT